MIRRSKSEDFSKISTAQNTEIGLTGGNIDELNIYQVDAIKSSAHHHNGNHQAYFHHKARKTDPTATQSSSSSSSNQSNYSVNSLLLSVKNLENFNKSNGAIQKYHHHRNRAESIHGIIEHNPNIILKSNYYFNYFLNQQEANHLPLYEHRWKMLQNIANITKDDDKAFASFDSRRKKEMEVDQLSTASSTTTTNFTVISLNDSDERLNKSKKAICRRSHTITILIFVMTTIFVIFISIMLFLMDMRNQKMPS